MTLNTAVSYLNNYWWHPVVLARKAPTPTTSHLTPLTPDIEAHMPPALLDELARVGSAIATRGFLPPLRCFNRIGTGRSITSAVLLFEHPNDVIGFAMASQSAHAALHVTVSLRSDFADGRQLITSNARALLRTPSRPNVDGARFADVNDPVVLYDIHAARVAEKETTVKRKPLTRGGDPIDFQFREAQETYQFWVKRGYYRWVGPDHIQMTTRGAMLASWRYLFPWKQLTERRLGRQAADIRRRLRV